MKTSDPLAIIQEGHKSEFWGLITDYLKERIASIDQAILNFDGQDLTAEHYRIALEALRERKDGYERLIELPEVLAQELQPTPPEIKLDPY